MRLLVLMLLVPTVAALPVPSPLAPEGEVATDQTRYQDGDEMLITFSNPSTVELDIPSSCFEIRDRSGLFTFYPADEFPSVACTSVAPSGSVTFRAPYAEWSLEGRLAPGEYNVVVVYRHGQGLLGEFNDRSAASAPVTLCTPPRAGPQGVADAAFLAARCG